MVGEVTVFLPKSPVFCFATVGLLVDIRPMLPEIDPRPTGSIAEEALLGREGELGGSSTMGGGLL